MPNTPAVENTPLPATKRGNIEVRLFEWKINELKLSEELGQPKDQGGSINSIHLDSMRHGVLINNGGGDFHVKAWIPPSLIEFIVILEIPGCVFVARYSGTEFLRNRLYNIQNEMAKLAGEMNVKLKELAGKDRPHERGVPDGTHLFVYYPENVAVVAINAMRNNFRNQSPIDLETIPYNRGKGSTLTITLPNREGSYTTRSLV